MTKPPTPPSNPLDPFRNARPFNPFPSGSPLAGNAARQSEARGVNVQSVQEQTRATGLPRQIDSGQAAPRFGDRPASAPFPAAGDRAAQPSVPVVKPSTSGRSK